MTVTQAFLLTFGLIGIGVTLSVAELYLLDLFENDLSENGFRHIFGLITWFSPLIAYAIIFKFSDFQVNLRSVPWKIRSLKPEILLYVMLIAVGLELLDRPIFDFEKIWNYFLSGTEQPYNIPDATRFIIYNGMFAIIFAPVLEELFFRKFLFGQLLKKYSATTAILVSSLCFAILHLPSYRNLLPTFIFGIVASLILKEPEIFCIR